MAPLEFKRLLYAQQQITALYLEPCSPTLRVFDRTGREFLIDVAQSSVRSCRFIDALESADQVEWSPCRRYAAILRVGKLAIWNRQNDETVPAPESLGTINRVAWRPNPADSEGELWVAGSCGFAVWSAEGGVLSRESAADIVALAWNPPGTCFGKADAQGGLEIWSVCRDQRVRLAQADGHAIRRLAWSANGAILVGASASKLIIWNIQAAFYGNGRATFVGLDCPASTVAFAPRGNTLAVGAIDGRLELMRAAETAGCRRSTTADAAITHLAWGSNGKHMAVATRLGQVCLVRVCK